MSPKPTAAKTFLAAHAVVEGSWVNAARFDVDDRGVIVAAGSGLESPPAPIVRDLGDVVVLPGFVNAHSHAFQRAIRGATHRRGEDDPSSFWSWREAMYRAATELTPESLYEITKRAYSEMLGAGVTCVGEFHYIHHQPDGTPYDDPNELSWRVAQAARDAGIRLVLLEVYYESSGFGAAPNPEQRRFCDPGVDAYLERVEALRAADLNVGLAPHSIRAVSPASLARLVAYAQQHGLVIHTHLSEQPLENEQCRTHHGKTPTQVFADAGTLDRGRTFTAVHATHVTAQDRARLATQHVCACPTTEADLGDGICPALEFLEAGVTMALGSDSNAIIDLVQEARLLEMGERLRTQRRLCLNDDQGNLGSVLAQISTHGGASSLGIAAEAGTLGPNRSFDAAVVDLQHPTLAGLPPTTVLDALLASGTASLIGSTIVRGVEQG